MKIDETLTARTPEDFRRWLIAEGRMTEAGLAAMPEKTMEDEK